MAAIEDPGPKAGDAASVAYVYQLRIGGRIPARATSGHIVVEAERPLTDEQLAELDAELATYGYRRDDDDS